MSSGREATEDNGARQKKDKGLLTPPASLPDLIAASSL